MLGDPFVNNATTPPSSSSWRWSGCCPPPAILEVGRVLLSCTGTMSSLHEIKSLDEIVDLSSQLQPEDQKTAAGFWYAALKQIQTLWSKSSPSQIDKHCAARQLLPGEESSTESKFCLINDWKRNIQQPRTPVIAKRVKDERKNGETRINYEEQNMKTVIKQELTTDGQEVEREDKIKINDPNEVQSVHLMISADPILVPNMSKFRKVYKNEVTGKTETAYQCEKCPKQCRTALALYKHRSSHSKSLECPICHQRLSNRHALNGDMERHLRIHTGERPFHCDVCGSSFARPQTLQEHKNRHFNFKPYVCKICDKSFHELAACSRHVKGLHGREKGSTPASANILRLANTDKKHEEEIGKQSILITQLNVGNGAGNGTMEDRDNSGEEEVREESEGIEEVEEEEEIKHHIFVMHTTDNEETELITIAESSNSHGENSQSQDSPVSCEKCGTLMSSVAVLRNHARNCKSQQGVSVAEWLVHRHRESPSTDMEVTVGDNSRSDEDLGHAEETSGGLECVEEVDGTGLSHAVTIIDDGSITSVPLSQLAPLHIQLENDYMVVLSNGT
nr:MDS1 and EVI1 complex locus protein EVI1-B-like isoform X5 [Procambarus clarkii]